MSDSERVLSGEPPKADRRLQYGEDPFQFGDLRLPSRPGPHPVVVFIHGGYYRARYDLTHAGFLCAAFARAGFASWSLEYRRLGNPGGGWPGTFQDVLRGLSHVGTIAEQYSLAPDRTVVVGHSAGGHLALWAATASTLPDESPLLFGQAFKPCGAVALAGVNDLRRAAVLGLSGNVVEELLGGAPDRVPGRYDEASPIERLPFEIPIRLIHGTRDEEVPFEMSQRFYVAARAAGGDVELVTLREIGHYEPIDPGSAAWPEVLGAVQQILQRAQPARGDRS